MYLKDKDRREKLLTNGLEINNVPISFFEKNLYSSGNQTKKHLRSEIVDCRFL